MQVKTSPKIEKFLISAAGQRFLKLAGMLGSGHAGEVANAAMIASKALTDAGLTWGEVLGSGPAPSQGGQQTAINDLTMRLRIAQEMLAVTQRQIGSLQSQLGKVKTENALLERAIDGMKKAADVPPIRSWQITKEDFDLSANLLVNLRQRDMPKILSALNIDPEVLKKDYRGAGTKSKPNRSGDRAYATDFQRDLNETLDEIAAAIDLNEWEQGFVGSLRDYKIRISEKQWDHLSRLARQAHVEVKVERP